MRRCLCLLPLVLFLFVSCGGSSGGGDGTAPVINNVVIYEYDHSNNAVYQNTFSIGDIAYFDITLTDPDLDIARVEVTEYSPDDSSTPFNGPHTLPLESQAGESMVYSFSTETVGPVGTYREEFQAFDAKGNPSNVFIKYTIVE